MIVHKNLRYFQVALKSENVTMARQVVVYTIHSKYDIHDWDLQWSSVCNTVYWEQCKATLPYFIRQVYFIIEPCISPPPGSNLISAILCLPTQPEIFIGQAHLIPVYCILPNWWKKYQKVNNYICYTCHILTVIFSAYYLYLSPSFLDCGI
jgi:hypothetical protein